MTPAAPETASASDAERLRALRVDAQRVASKLRLPRMWSFHTGMNGKPGGATSGSSLEFRDHRPYVPGDDFRHIDWVSSARSPGFLMKVFEEDRAPALDLIVDCSTSMWYDEGKGAQTLRLAFLFEQLCRQEAVSLRVFPLGAVPGELRVALNWVRTAASSGGGEHAVQELSALPLRHRSVRVVLSDLLFPVAPDLLLRPLVRNAGAALLLAPYAQAEQSPDADGRVELVECEGGARRQGWVDREVLADYARRYQQHFGQWREAAAAFRVIFLRTGAGVALNAVAGELAQHGALELRG